MNLRIKKLIIILIVGLSPAIILIIGYAYLDPFKVLRKYKTYFDTPIWPNRDYVSTEMLLNNIDKYNYDSFIFGSSRAIAYKPSSWLKHLEKNSSPFIFDASGESIYGIYTKLRFLDNRGIKLNNALIIFCRNGVFKKENYTNSIGIKHPKITGQSLIYFHLLFLKSYFDLKFLLGYYSYMFSGKQNKFTAGIIQDKLVLLDTKTNSLNLIYLEEQLKKDSSEYYMKINPVFFKRNGEKFEPEKKIDPDIMKMLQGIENILKKNNTKYKIVLSPIYDQIKFSKADKEILKSVFGNNLYDFTGENFITKNNSNWYETFHYKPFIADSIMNIIYGNDSAACLWR